MDTSDAAERARELRRDAGGRRDQLLNAAERCFAEDGYDGTTVGSIAARAETSRPTFYAYFASKDEVFQALAKRTAEALVATQLVIDVDSVEPHEVLGATTRAFVEELVEHAALLALIEQRAPVDPVVGEVRSAWRNITRRRFTKFLERLAAAGAVSPCVSPERIVDTVSYALMSGAAGIVDASEDEREHFITDHIIITERLVGVSPRTEEQ